MRKQFSGLLQFVTVCLDNLVHLAILLKFVKVYLNLQIRYICDNPARTSLREIRTEEGDKQGRPTSEEIEKSRDLEIEKEITKLTYFTDQTNELLEGNDYR